MCFASATPFPCIQFKNEYLRFPIYRVLDSQPETMNDISGNADLLYFVAYLDVCSTGFFGPFT
jgi:hypothetical protein